MMIIEEKSWHLHMTDLFIHHRDIGSRPGTIWEFGNIWKNVVMVNNGYLVNHGTPRSITDLHISTHQCW